jgi:hypothetical protein
MTSHSGLRAEEWELLGNAALAACTAVAIAEPGGGSQEADALIKGWREAGALFPQSELIQAIVRNLDPERRAEREGGVRGAVAAAIVAALCDRAVRLLEERAAPAETDAYKQFVMHMATRVAQASVDGGILGLGGVRITIEERSALREIAAALRYTP